VALDDPAWHYEQFPGHGMHEPPPQYPLVEAVAANELTD